MFGETRPDLTVETRKGLPGDFVELSAGVTHYEVQGDPDGETVVLIHGNAAPYVTWDGTIGDLTKAGFRVLRYDLFGHGFSDRPNLPAYDRHFYNVQLADLLNRLGITSPVLVVGSSQGGSIGACFASQHPGRVKKLALLAPFFDELPGSQSLVYRLLTTPPLGELVMRLISDRKLTDLSDDVVDADIRSALEHDAVQQFRFRGKHRAFLANLRGDALKDATGCYQGVKEQGIPVLLAWGTSDQKLPAESMRRLRDLIPDIEYHELEGAGHLAHYEYPERVNPILIRFLTN
ncbi:MAG: alpha/beta hydrolase [Candidatus Nanopelagicales bacterium]